MKDFGPTVIGRTLGVAATQIIVINGVKYYRYAAQNGKYTQGLASSSSPMAWWITFLWFRSIAYYFGLINDIWFLDVWGGINWWLAILSGDSERVCLFSMRHETMTLLPKVRSLFNISPRAALLAGECYHRVCNTQGIKNVRSQRVSRRGIIPRYRAIAPWSHGQAFLDASCGLIDAAILPSVSCSAELHAD